MSADPPLILVWQPGKVASQSVHRALYRQYPGSVFYGHDFQGFFPNEKLSSALEEKRRIYLITGVRELVAYAMSHIFQGFEQAEGDPREAFYRDPDAVLDALEERIPLRAVTESKFKWYDLQYKEFLGLDIFSHAFDKEKGIASFEHENASVLCYDLDKVSRRFSEVIGDFIGEGVGPIDRHNDASQKHFRVLYQVLKRSLSVPEDMMDRIYRGRALHFFSESDIRSFKARWSNSVSRSAAIRDVAEETFGSLCPTPRIFERDVLSAIAGDVARAAAQWFEDRKASVSLPVYDYMLAVLHAAVGDHEGRAKAMDDCRSRMSAGSLIFAAEEAAARLRRGEPLEALAVLDARDPHDWEAKFFSDIQGWIVELLVLSGREDLAHQVAGCSGGGDAAP